jgi:hypothetical protein
MVYDFQNLWVCGLYSLSTIMNTRKHVLETESISHSVGSLRRDNPNHWTTQAPDDTLSRRNLTGRYAVKNCDACPEWKYDTNGSDNLATNLSNK